MRHRKCPSARSAQSARATFPAAGAANARRCHGSAWPFIDGRDNSSDNHAISYDIYLARRSYGPEIAAASTILCAIVPSALASRKQPGHYLSGYRTDVGLASPSGWALQLA